MSGSDRVTRGGLQIARELDALVEEQIAPGTGVDVIEFWNGFEAIVNDLGPVNQALLAKRDQLQEQIDTWHLARVGQTLDPAAYRAFLTEIGYLVPEPDAFSISTENVDEEIAVTAGPQLVVPVMNARFALNAGNARWGSLYDALYGTDILPEEPGREKGTGYNPARGELVVARATEFLDAAVPLDGASHTEVVAYGIGDGEDENQLRAILDNGGNTGLSDPDQFVGHVGDEELSVVLLINNGLHVEIQIDREHSVGQAHPAGVKDVVLESAITTIQDCEDSVTAVDAADKCIVYENWLGLMKGDLETSVDKGGRTILRRLNPDRSNTAVRFIGSMKVMKHSFLIR